MWAEIWPRLLGIAITVAILIAISLFKLALAKKMRSGKLKTMLLKEWGAKPDPGRVTDNAMGRELLISEKTLPRSNESYFKRSFRLTVQDSHFKIVLRIAIFAFGPGFIALAALGLYYVLKWLGIVSP